MLGTDTAPHLVAVTRGGGLLHAAGSRADFDPVKAGDRGPLTATCAAVVDGDLHTAAVTRSGGLVHAVRRASGVWVRFGDVKSHAGNPGHVADVAATAVDGTLRLLVRTATGGLFLTRRRADGSWTPFDYLKGLTGDPGFVTDLAVTTVGRDLHVLATTNRGRLHHAIRWADGTWRAFHDVAAQRGRIAAAGVAGALHVLAHTVDRVRHLIHRADRGWERADDLTTGPRHVTDLAAAGVGGELHVLLTTATGGLDHAVRGSAGTWSGAGERSCAAARAAIT